MIAQTDTHRKKADIDVKLIILLLLHRGLKTTEKSKTDVLINMVN